ncbi:hypothetical protein F2P56_008730 [Juglans regia]|uniref:Uncharacterized protein n=1 Tax=Juglans regia TaxID=51240 RepID=A0A833XV48_JUGRE|nr:hypothetical protein F2P56_008730 [Juglans regia]
MLLFLTNWPSFLMYINRDPMAAQEQRMRRQIEQSQAELLFYRGDASSLFEELQEYIEELRHNFANISLTSDDGAQKLNILGAQVAQLLRQIHRTDKAAKQLLESRKASSSCETSSAENGNGPGIQNLMQAIGHVLEVAVRVYETINRREGLRYKRLEGKDSEAQ